MHYSYTHWRCITPGALHHFQKPEKPYGIDHDKLEFEISVTPAQWKEVERALKKKIRLMKRDKQPQ